MFNYPDRFAQIFADWVKTWPENPKDRLPGLPNSQTERNYYASRLEECIIHLFIRSNLEKDYDIQMEVPEEIPEQEIRKSMKRYNDFRDAYFLTFGMFAQSFDIHIDEGDEASYPSAGSLVEILLFKRLSTPEKVLKLRNFSTFKRLANQLKNWCQAVTNQCKANPYAGYQIRDALPLIKKLQNYLGSQEKLIALHQAISKVLRTYGR